MSIDPQIYRMGKHHLLGVILIWNYIQGEEANECETKHLSTKRKRKSTEYSKSVGDGEFEGSRHEISSLA